MTCNSECGVRFGVIIVVLHGSCSSSFFWNLFLIFWDFYILFLYFWYFEIFLFLRCSDLWKKLNVTKNDFLTSIFLYFLVFRLICFRRCIFSSIFSILFFLYNIFFLSKWINFRSGQMLKIVTDGHIWNKYVTLTLTPKCVQFYNYIS